MKVPKPINLLSLGFCLTLFFEESTQDLDNLMGKPQFEGEWIDVNEMFDVEAVINKINNGNKAPAFNIPNKPLDKCVCPKCEPPKISPDVGTKHCKAFGDLLNIIATRTNIEHVAKLVTIKATIMREEFDEFRKYIDESCSNDEDNALLNLLRITSSIEEIPELSIFDHFSYVSIFIAKHSTLITLLAFAGTCFLLLIWMWYFSRSWYQVLFRAFLLVFIVSCLWSWMRLYQNVLAEKEAKLARLPAECQPNEMTLSQSVFSWLRSSFTFKDDPCVEYHKALLVDTIWEVNPFVAISDTITRILLHPLGLAGEYLSAFFRNLFKGLPVQIWPFVGLIICTFVFLLMIMRYGYRIRLPAFLGAIEPVEFNPNRLIERDRIVELEQRVQNVALQGGGEQRQEIAERLAQIEQRLEEIPQLDQAVLLSADEKNLNSLDVGPQPLVDKSQPVLDVSGNHEITNNPPDESD